MLQCINTLLYQRKTLVTLHLNASPSYKYYVILECSLLLIFFFNLQLFLSLLSVQCNLKIMHTVE